MRTTVAIALTIAAAALTLGVGSVPVEASSRVSAIDAIYGPARNTCYESFREAWPSCPDGAVTMGTRTMVFFHAKPSKISIVDARTNTILRKRRSGGSLCYHRTGRRRCLAIMSATGILISTAPGHKYVFYWWG